MNTDNKVSKHLILRLIVTLAIASLCGTATAKVVFAQTGTETSTGNGGSASDSDSGFEVADDVTLATAATIRSVKWWGFYGLFEKTPVAPFSFQIIFYGDSGGLPDLNNVLSTTAVQFAALSPPTEIIPGTSSNTNYYEFRANVTPTAIPAGTKVWLSVIANTANDSDDSFLIRKDDMGDAAERNNTSNPFVASVNQRVLFELNDSSVRQVSTVYADDFNGTGGLHNSAPDQRPSSETWTASADWQANGTTTAVNSNSEDDSAFLPFTPLPGKIYTLSATLQQPTNGFSSSSIDAWAGIGFTEVSNVGSFSVSPNNPAPWMVVRRTGDLRTYSGTGITGSVNEGIYDKTRIIKVVLDTTSPEWKAEWFVGLRSLRTHTFSSNPAINFIGLARENGVAADFDAFSLTVENGDVVPEIISFSQVASNVWELELAAESDTPYEFRFSTNLVFSPGDLVANLSKGNPGDSGTIGGPNQSVVTTDNNGGARLRMTLTEQPKNFVRAVRLP